MKNQFARNVCLLVFAVGGSLLFTLHAAAMSPKHAALPLAFEANRGQADATAEFLARGDNYALLLSAGGDATLRLSLGPHGRQHDAVLQLSLAGARADVAGAAENENGPRASREPWRSYGAVGWSATRVHERAPGEGGPIGVEPEEAGRAAHGRNLGGGWGAAQGSREQGAGIREQEWRSGFPRRPRPASGRRASGRRR